MKRIDAKTLGLSARDRVEQIASNHLALVVDRKSRIIMADGRRILEKVDKIRKHGSDAKISLKTNAPVCSKTRAFLHENEIRIDSID